MSTFPEALKEIRSAKTVIRQLISAGGATREMWATALEVLEDDILREWNEANANWRAEVRSRHTDACWRGLEDPGGACICRPPAAVREDR